MMKKHLRTITLLIGICCWLATAISLQAQIRFPSCIRYDKNVLVQNHDSNYRNVLEKIWALQVFGGGKVKILQLGDSHVQPDFFPGVVRSRLQTEFVGCTGDRGFLFPYRVAKTNGPLDYKDSFTGKWTGCRNVEKNKGCEWGLAGITASTEDTSATIKLVLKQTGDTRRDFNQVKIYYNTEDTVYQVRLDSCELSRPPVKNMSDGYILFSLKSYVDSIILHVTRRDTLKSRFCLQGIYLENDDPGFEYSTLGVNGAEVTSFLRSTLFSKHLNSLSPDLVIISLGTNDAYSPKFNPDTFKAIYVSFIRQIREVLPCASILLTTPGDSYRKRKGPNKNMETASAVINDLAREQHVMVWDWYQVMGGFGSVKTWFKGGLTAKDKLHFSRGGYLIQGNLLFDAIFQSYDEYLAQ